MEEQVQQEVKVSESKPKTPEAELRKTKRELAKVTKEFQQVSSQHEALMQEHEQLKRNVDLMKGYNRAALENLSDQLQVVKRQVQITLAGGEING